MNSGSNTQSKRVTTRFLFTSARLTIYEGRFHQVKRMFKAVGCEVTYLRRETFGSLTLENLPKGEYKKITINEITGITETTK